MEVYRKVDVIRHILLFVFSAVIGLFVIVGWILGFILGYAAVSFKNGMHFSRRSTGCL